MVSLRILFAITALLFFPCALVSVHAEVIDLTVTKDEIVDGGREFGETGSYRRLEAIVHYRFHATHPRNASIVDLERAPRDEHGYVHAKGNIIVYVPSDPSLGAGTALVEVSNRGGQASLRYFNGAGGRGVGDGLLMRRGLTYIAVGWQFDVPPSPGVLRLDVPVAKNLAGSSVQAGTIQGLARAEWTLDQEASVLELSHRSHIAYPVSDPGDPRNVLTVRDGRLSPRSIVPRGQWRFAHARDGGVTEDRTHIFCEDGFTAGKIYELVYVAQDPSVVGLGLAVVRDIISYAKNDSDCPFPVDRGIALGISQTGRFLRHFLYQGFNTDEDDRKAYDGALILTAGAGRGSFNHRFAQPSRDAHRYSAFFYPTDIFPFSERTQWDSVRGLRDGLMQVHQQGTHSPRIFYVNTGYEYWGRAASLLHTSLEGSADVSPLESSRIYHVASAQHFPVSFPPRDDRGNPVDMLLVYRALLVSMQEWIENDSQPPNSLYPRIDEGTLVSVDSLNFPALPGLKIPNVIHEAYRADYGPSWALGVVTYQPPVLGKAFPSLVSAVDSFGNELGGLRTLETLAPLATYTPWHVRKNLAGGNGELTDFYGGFYPLPRNEEERAAQGDPRRSIESLYESREAYLERVEERAEALVAMGVLLEEDLEKAVQRAEATWDWIFR